MSAEALTVQTAVAARRSRTTAALARESQLRLMPSRVPQNPVSPLGATLPIGVNSAVSRIHLATPIETPVMMHDAPAVRPNFEIDGDTILIHDGLIGHGGTSRVYKAEDRETGSIYAVKFPLEKEGVEQFLRREATIMSGLVHSHLVGYRGSGVKDGRFFIAMEFITGRTVRAMMQDDSVSLHERLRVVHAACYGLSYLHGKGIVHGDIKPDNIIVTGEGEVKILDFGLCTFYTPELEGMNWIRPIGTAFFRSPEQRENNSLDPRSDIFSLGRVLRVWLSKHHFWSMPEMDTGETLKREMEPLPDLPPSVPPSIRNVVLKMTAEKPEERFQTSEDAQEALAEEIQNLEALKGK